MYGVVNRIYILHMINTAQKGENVLTAVSRNQSLLTDTSETNNSPTSVLYLVKKKQIFYYK